MLKTTLEEKLTLIVLIISLILYIAGVSDFSGLEDFILIVCSALSLAFLAFICNQNELLKKKSGIVLLILSIVISATFFIFLILNSAHDKYMKLHYSVILLVVVFTLFSIPFSQFKFRQLLTNFKEFSRHFWIYLAFVFYVALWLKIINYLTPFTYDVIFDNLDKKLFGFSPDFYVKKFMTTGLEDWFHFFYGLLPFLPIILALILYLNKEYFQFRRVNLSFLLTGLIGWICYLVFPAIGPIYLGVNLPANVYFSAFRNCFPSLHTTWVLIVLIYAWKYKKKVFWLLLIVGSQIILATVFLRLHYVIDLIASIPFTLFIYWLSNKLSKRYYTNERSLALIDKEKLRKYKSEYVVITIFILSGMTALIYEMFFLKKISLIFGSTALAVTTVLASYMFGLAVGGWFGGKLADKVKSPIKMYAFAEVIVGVVVIIAPTLFNAVEKIYIYAGKNWHIDTFSLTVLRASMTIFIIILPTFAMGATLPLLTRYITLRREKISRSISSLYSANLVGAALGIFLATYLLIPNLGLTTTISIAVVFNFLIALWAFKISKTNPERLERVKKIDYTKIIDKVYKDPWNRMPTGWMNRILIFSVILLGFVSFAGEVIWTHLLAMIAGNSVYAFGIMLFSVLFGLAIGGYVVRQLSLTDKHKLIWIGVIQFVLAVFLVLQLMLWDKIPPFLSQLGISANTFAKREFVRFAIAFLMMILPTFSIGLSFPLIASLYSRNIQTLGTKVGRITFYNTIGNILGTITAGFILIPLIGSYKATIVVIILASTNGIILLNTSLLKRRIFYTFGFFLFLLVVLFLLPPWNLTKLSMGSNVYFSQQHNGKVVDYWEEKDGGFTTVTEEKVKGSEKIKRTMWTNGKFQGDNGWERLAQARFALYPILFVKERSRALVIGFGTGESARIVMESGFKHIDIVEISPGIIEAANKYFIHENSAVLSHPASKLHIADGRNFLLLNQKPFNLITMEISSIWFAGASALYNVEFYQLAKNNLTNEGIFQQWIQLHHISTYDLLSIISSVRYVFKNIRLFFGGNQGVIVASDLPLHIPFSRMQRFFKDKQFQNIQKISPYGNIFCLLGEELLDPEEINQYINYFKITLNSDIENFISTDDNLFLEYSTPKGNLKSYIHSLNKNVNLLLKFDRNPNNIVTNIPSKGWQLFINGCVALGGNKTQKGMDWLKEARELLPDEEQKTIDRMIRHVMNTKKK